MALAHMDQFIETISAAGQALLWSTLEFIAEWEQDHVGSGVFVLLDGLKSSPELDWL